jgi:methionyl-tRNA formyltransferase
MSAKRLAYRLAGDLPRLWKEAQPQGPGSYWPRMSQTQRTLDWNRSVDEILRTMRAFGSIETFAQINSRFVYVWEGSGWREAHGHKPGTLVHRHRHHLVIAARDGFIQLTGWSSYAPQGPRHRD